MSERRLSERLRGELRHAAEDLCGQALLDEVADIEARAEVAEAKLHLAEERAGGAFANAIKALARAERAERDAESLRSRLADAQIALRKIKDVTTEESVRLIVKQALWGWPQ